MVVVVCVWIVCVKCYGVVCIWSLSGVCVCVECLCMERVRMEYRTIITAL